jgi:acyl carrier protein
MDARFVAPRTEVERKISGVWQDVLKVEQVGVHDNFFELGGHSLLLLQLRSKLQGALGVKLSMVDLFRHPTVGALAKSLRVGAEKANSREWLADERVRASSEAAELRTLPSS